MIIITYQNLRNFHYWMGAKDTVNWLTYQELDELEDYLQEMYPDGITELELNDFFWFEDDTIAKYFGYDDWEHLTKDRRCPF